MRDWYRRRYYAHFDRPLTREQAHRLVTSPERVASHAFWPAIVNPRRSVSRKKQDGRRERAVKLRPIAFCAHSDAHIYSYYARCLEALLEEVYRDSCGNSVLAYRSFEPPQCNIHFAHSAFQEAASRQPVDLVAIDVEGFFDSLDHEVLKSAWARLLGEGRLPADHFAVFKACTRDTAVTLPELRDIFRGEVRRGVGRSAASICSPAEFRQHVAPRLRPRHTVVYETKHGRGSSVEEPEREAAGVPQGLPISAVLANVYMLSTDQAIAAEIAALGGSYRRYSDDILLIVPQGAMAKAEAIVLTALAEVRLKVNVKKTERHRLRLHDGRLTSFALDELGQEDGRSPCSYLGLSYDATSVRVRASTLSRFKIKARRAIARARMAAERRFERTIKRRQLYARLTSLGYGSAYGNYDNRLRRPPGAPRLGFFKYLKLAEEVTGSEAIALQLRQLESCVFRWIHEAERALQASSCVRCRHSTA